jgi:hypothetical protein
MPVLEEKRQKLSKLGKFSQQFLKFYLNGSPFSKKKSPFHSLFAVQKRTLRVPSNGANPPKNVLNIAFLTRCPPKLFSPFCSTNPEISVVKVCCRQSESQNIDNKYRGMQDFF